jgi:hypothetical protein
LTAFARVLLTAIAWMERSASDKLGRDGTKIVALSVSGGNLFTDHDHPDLVVIACETRHRSKSKAQFATSCASLRSSAADDVSEIMIVDAQGNVMVSTVRAQPDHLFWAGREVLSRGKRTRPQGCEPTHIVPGPTQLFSLSKRTRTAAFAGSLKSQLHICQPQTSPAPGSPVLSLFTWMHSARSIWLGTTGWAEAACWARP